ncbi:ABC transporter permease subunit [Myxococcota bacterium]|nr:ABC transporter permease subunit [Myxococcota bacterium]
MSVGRGGRLAFAALRRVVAAVGSVLGATLLLQALVGLAPGDAADLAANDPALRDALSAAWGLDEPLLTRWSRFVLGALGGDLGESLTVRPGASVWSLITAAAGRSSGLVAAALALGLGLALPLGFGGARARRLTLVFSAAPVFLALYAVMTGLNEGAWALIEAGKMERPGWFALPDADSGLRWALGACALAWGSSSLAELQAATADELTRLRRAPFVLAAQARGEPAWPVALRSLLPPLSEVAASQVAVTLGGLIVVERALQLNGAGSLFWQACRLRDLPLACGLAAAAALVVAGARLTSDLTRLWLDPRLREAP